MQPAGSGKRLATSRVMSSARDHANCRARAGLLICSCTLWVQAGCQGGPSGGVESLVSRGARQAAVRTRSAAKLESQSGGVARSETAQAMVDRLGGRLLATAADCRIDCYFRVLRSSRMNAFSVPEGGVYITAGLYNRLTTDDLLAAALAHEIAHVATGDGWHRARSQAEQLQKEIRADGRAAEYLSAAGFDPAVLLDLMELLRDEQYPGWADARIRALEDQRTGLVPRIASTMSR